MRKFSVIALLSFAMLATIFFDDPHLYFYKRIIYVIFMALSVWQLYLFYFKPRPADEDGLPWPRFYKPYTYLLIAFIVYNLLTDLRNPAFSLVTQLNHPLAALVVIPIFSFGVGYRTPNIQPVIRFLLVTCILFSLFFIVPLQGNNIYALGLTSCYAVLPLTIFAIDQKKYRLFIPFLIVCCIVISSLSDSRTIILRLLLFFGLLAAMTPVKRWGPFKLVVIIVAAFFIYQFLSNLQWWLEMFSSYIHVKSFDTEDTRTFLYNEFFDDVKPGELLLGRGFQGTYFSPYFFWLQASNNDFTGDFYYRFAVEVGFLQLILKGGIAFFLLFITPLVGVVYQGLFTRHTSRQAFLIAVYILCELMILFIENIPAYHFQFFLIYFLAGYGYRQVALNKSPSYEVLRHNALLQSGAVY